MQRPTSVIIDTDPGVDDGVALLMALAAPSLKVVGLTTVGGNVPLARGTRNALALLEYARRTDVPVFRGSARPLRGRFSYSYAFHGPGGLSRRLPNPVTRPGDTGAVDFLAGQLDQAPGQITVVALGPLTNLARLLRKHPAALGQAAALVVMGGAVRAPGNVTPHAEFNFHSDPEAAQLVVASGIPLTLVDLAACRQVGITLEEAAQLEPLHPLGQLAVQLLQNWFRRDASRRRFEFYDPLALSVALDPQIVSTRPVSLALETSDRARLGESRVIVEGGPVAVVDRVDSQRFFRLLQEILGLSSPRVLGEG